MPILNYTTQIGADKTIMEIQQILASHNADAILNEYGNGYIIAMSFRMTINEKSIGFKLPCEWKPILKILEDDPKVPGKLKTREQALRVSWRIVKDWVEAQMAFIEAKQVKFEQVFLSYAVGQDGRTFFESVEANNLLTEGDK